MLEKRTFRRAAVLAALLLVGGAAVYRMGPAPAREPDTAGRFRKDTVEIETAAGTRRIGVELAVTPAEQTLGLMYRTRLADTEGMLFLHSKPGEIRMWMRNTYIPLDMVFIRADGTVHRIAAMTEPLSEATVASNGEVTAVLEMNGGAAARLGIKPGDKVRHGHFR